MQKYDIPDMMPRLQHFRKAVHKARAAQRMKRNRGFAFSQNEGGQADIMRLYDTTRYDLLRGVARGCYHC